MPAARPAVLFLTESFHPVLGGGETHIRRLAGQLVRAGWAATVLTRRSAAEWPRADALDGVDIVRVEPSGPGRGGKYKMVPAALRALLRPSLRFDLLVVRGTRVLGLPGLLAARLRGVPVVLQPEIDGEISGRAYVWGTALEGTRWWQAVRAGVALRNLLLRDGDVFVAMSRAIASEMREAGVAAAKVEYLPHGIDTGRFHPAAASEKATLRAALGLPAGALVVAWTGRLLKGKGLPALLESFAVLAREFPEARLLLVGSGAGQALSIEDALRARACAPDLDGRVAFAGRADDVAPHLRAADVFAFPSEVEALGLSLLEASACGLACVGARTGGIVDVIDEDANGLLVPPRDVPALTAALRRLLSDEGLRARLGAAARATALARFDERQAEERYRALFQELLQRGRA